MISILDPRAWIAAIALCAASVGIGYWRGNVAGKASVQAAWNQERAEQAVWPPSQLACSRRNFLLTAP